MLTCILLVLSPSGIPDLLSFNPLSLALRLDYTAYTISNNYFVYNN